MRDFRWPPPPDGGPRTYGPGPSAPRTGRPSLPEPPTDVVPTPHGVMLERLVTGAGEPVTVFAHGLGSGIAETRPLGSAVPGRKVFFQFRGHGRSATPPGPWTYADLARDLRAIADLSGATQALGVSLGASAGAAGPITMATSSRPIARSRIVTLRAGPHARAIVARAWPVGGRPAPPARMASMLQHAGGQSGVLSR